MEAGEVTLILRRMTGEDDESARKAAYDQLVALVYNDLRNRARLQLRNERADSVHPTVLVHEVYERLLGYRMPFTDRNHFFNVAGTAMRRVLIERARRMRAERRGSGQVNSPFEDDASVIASTVDPDLLLDIDQALQGLRPEQAKMIELRFFVGLTLEETADVMGIQFEAAKKRWAVVKTLLFDKLQALRA